MIENLAVVEARVGQQVRLRSTSPSGCARCDAGKGCGGGVFGKLIDRRLQGLLLGDNGLNLDSGQFVILGIESGVFLKATALIYLCPLFCLLLGAALAAGRFSEPGTIVGGILGLLLGAWLAPRIREKYLDSQLHPQLLRRALPADLQACQIQ